MDLETDTVLVLLGAEKLNETLLLAALKDGREALPKEIGAEVVVTMDGVAGAEFALKFNVGAVAAEVATLEVDENPLVVEVKPLNPVA